jgi:hypothetical protein
LQSFDYDEEKSIYLKDFVINEFYDNRYILSNFTILYLDSSEIPVVVLGVFSDYGYGYYIDGYEILEYYNGVVYGYYYGNRCIGNL